MKKSKIYEFYLNLQKQNPEPKGELYYVNNYTLLIAVVLSAQATDIGVNRATRPLFKKIQTPKQMIELGETRLRSYIRTIGLFNSKAKITTYKSLKWHMLVLYYLNTENSLFVANYVFKHIANKENGFVTFFIKEKLLDSMIRDVIEQGGEPPKNKLRRVIFKPYSGLDLSEKLSIVGKLIGRSSRVDEESIYQTMLDLNELEKKITIAKIANLLNCSVRTIHRIMSKELKQEKQKLNDELWLSQFDPKVVAGFKKYEKL